MYNEREMTSDLKGPLGFNVGTIVRVSTSKKRTRRATIATLQTEESVATKRNNRPTSVCLIWEPIAPMPLSMSKEKFLITPTIDINQEAEEEEAIVDITQVQSLLSFEQHVSESHESDSIQKWKDRGDQLLRIGDASSATSYYEIAIVKTSSLSIGCSILTNVNGYPRVAEVDCLDNESIDVTLYDTQEEITIPKTHVLLVLMNEDHTDRLQERILLNLARCMLQIGEAINSDKRKFWKAAVLACSLAIAVNDFHDKQNEQLIFNLNNDTLHTALVLRAKAHAALCKWKNAISDATKICKAGKEKEGKKLLTIIQRQKQQQVKGDKKLAKAICQLVENVTVNNQTSVSENENQIVVMSSDESLQSKVKDTQTSFLNPVIVLISMTVVLMIQYGAFTKAIQEL